LKKHSVNILGHATSITLEEDFWALLKSIATEKNVSVNQMIAEIDSAGLSTNLSSAIRLYLLRYLQSK
jgi:predicted DNA-binding ribbon-helix-helix protein